MKLSVLSLGYLKTNCYLLEDEASAQCLAIDPGDEPERICAFLQEKGLGVKAVLITHGHFDHVGAAGALCEAYGCPLYCALDEYADSQNDPVYGRIMANAYASFRKAFLQYGLAAREGEPIPFGGTELSVLRVPGHSVGSLCYYLAEEGLLFGGDTLFPGGLGREDFFVSRGGEPGTLAAAVKEKLLVLPDETRVLPGHGAETSIGRERRTNLYLM